MHHKIPLRFLVLFLFMHGLHSCESPSTNKGNKSSDNLFSSSKVETDEIGKLLKINCDSNAAMLKDIVKDDSTISLKTFSESYALGNFEPYWLQKSGLSNYASEFLHALDSLTFDGLDAENYHYKELLQKSKDIEADKIKSPEELARFDLEMTYAFLKSTKDLVIGKDFESKRYKDWKNKNDTLFNEANTLFALMNSDNFKKSFDSLRPNHIWYTKFREEYTKLYQFEHQGGWPSIQNLKDSIPIGYNSPDIVVLRKRLFSEISSPTDTSSSICDENLLDAIKKYQHLNHVKVSGQIDTSTLKKLNKGSKEKLKTLAINMERMRWLKRNFSQPFIWVDIPRMELDYYEHDSVQYNMRVVVGKLSRQTPTLDSWVENIVFSPPWTVPPTIMKEEVVPGIARRGGSYLARRGLKAYRGGRQVNPSMINASNYRQFSIGQAPGYRSSLGEVKFNMHDTPHREDFVKSYRAYSSGCIRVHHPKEFAAFLLQDTSNYSYAKIDSICKKRQTMSIPMKRRIDVHVVYLTNSLDSVGNVVFLKDIYGLDAKMN